MKDKKKSVFVEWIEDVAELIKDNKRIVLAVITFIVLLAAAIMISTRIAKGSKEAVAVMTEEAAEATGEYVITEEALKKDAYPEINNLMKKYYAAAAEGDLDTIQTLRSGLDDKEKIVISKKSEYVESYPTIVCYTKPGPLEKTYLAYVNYEVKLKEFDDLVPGMNVWYVCVDDSGKYYINEDPQDDKIIEYCKIVSVQDDVQDLSNTVNVKYNEIMENNTELAKFMDELGVQMKVDVGEELAKAQLPEAEPETTTEPESEPEPEEPEETVKTVRAITVVNVRASDSEKADKVGKAELGQEFTLLEEKENGWSKIQYEDKEAFIKSEYLEAASVEAAQTDDTDTDDADDNKTSEDKNDNSAADNSKSNSDSNKSEDNDAIKNSPSSGTGTASDTVKVRKEASTDSEQLGLLYGGEKVEIVEKQSNGWTKVKYKSSTGYVKSEYLR